MKRCDHASAKGGMTMEFFKRFTFLLCAPGFNADDLEGERLQRIIAAIEDDGFQVVKARRVEDAEIAVQTDAAIGCMVVDWSRRGLQGKTAELINLMRRPAAWRCRSSSSSAASASRISRWRCLISSTATSSSRRRRRNSS